jgi:outer membrane protein assembly factor BamE
MRRSISHFGGLAISLAAAVLATAGCSWMPASLTSTDSFLGLITPYRIDIVQGNVVTKEQADLVKVGMPRSQVRDVLGSPMLADAFHADRWDYLFTIRRPGTEPQRRSVVVTFERDVVKSIQAPQLPSEKEFVAGIAKPVEGKAPLLELSAEQRKALPVPAARPEVKPEPTGAVRAYPPLEPT